MKKKSLLLAISAMSIAAVGVGTVGTFAWYQANNNASVNKGATQTGNMTVGVSSYDATNGFTITPSAITASSSVAFTDNTGATKVSVPNGTGYDVFDATTEASKIIAYTVKATITYSGDLNVKASIQALWEDTIDDVILDMSCTSVDNTSENHVPIEGTGVAGDVKFTSGATNYVHNAANMKVSLASSSFTFGNPTGESKPYGASTAEVTVGTIYVGLAGRADLVVDATHMPVYTLTLGASQSE